VDILVNNAGVFEPKSFFEIPDEDWLRLFQINVLAGVRLSRAYMPAMLFRNWGRIVFISSESALNIPKEMIHYGFTKAGELAVARGLAQLTAGTAVTVNSVLPGPTSSDGVEAFLAKMAERLGKPVDEMAADFIREYSVQHRSCSVSPASRRSPTWSCTQHSKKASATNGAALRVEGGIVQTIV
jgi:NAD(P)-dependent dehydrogenase (short-subunit alcohol dehydrogenase family)